MPTIRRTTNAIIAAGRAIRKLIRNLSFISTPCVFVAAIVVSDITERLAPNIAPPITVATIRGSERPALSAVATAIKEHYLPISSEGDLPETKIGAVLAIADKLDSIFSFFTVGMIPSGSNDPYALRRQAYGIVRIIEAKNWAFPLVRLQREIDQAINEYQERFGVQLSDGQQAVIDFIKGRFRQLLTTKQIRHDVIDAVLNAKQSDLTKVFAAAQLFKERLDEEEFKPSMEALTRVVNLAKKAQETTTTEINPALFENEAETALYQAVAEMKKQFGTQTLKEDYDQLVALRPLIETYFDQTMVMVDDPAVRNNRLAQLKQIAEMALSIASLDQIITK